MRTEPRELDRADLTELLGRAWGLTDVELDYLPVGFGSHHWCATDRGGERRFVTADDLEAGFQHGPDSDAAFAALERAFRTAAALRRDAGLEFVVAPLPGRGGAVLHRLGPRFALTVFPFVEGASGELGSYEAVPPGLGPRRHRDLHAGLSSFARGDGGHGSRVGVVDRAARPAGVSSRP